MTTTDENTVQHHETDHRGAFAIHQDGQKMAEMTYSKAGTSRIIVDHTEVDEALRGQGAGLKMLQ
ncbi:MAG: N-acetyltransferase, partial [Myxococcota bacterium]